ncbi:formate dehydrogenase [Pandoraea terrae]|uniref:Formate dehydrogenase n=1 Tax=Pandoraea terrae TaxID=1537710 RepID=A0A5E4SC28_9BURK|nr:NAD(P)H-dependent oxidoreductase subunit E [Pandoraea terrae]VVD73177.1 formate dehydrogenase [Pandoraea terrae]
MAHATHETLAPLLARHAGKPAELLELLHSLQDTDGFVDPAHLPAIAAALNLSRAEVHGVVTFYHHFRTAPPPRTIIQLCRAEACQSRGGEALARHIEGCTGGRFDGEPCGDIGLESVYCLGQCALSPALTINDTLHARVTPARFDALLSEAQSACAEGDRS